MNKNEFYVGTFRIDMKRNQVIAQESIMSMEPKVLAVLLILAEHQGEVVSHQEIADKVWPNSVVIPNALQRCIAQLRKAFGDDAKQQAVIKTHAKKGYSLIAKVSWQQTVLPTTEQAKDNSNDLIITPTKVIALLSMLVLCIALWFNNSSDTPKFNKLTPITSTDKAEFFSSFSPNGRYIAFTRNESEQQTNLWVKDLQQNMEYQVSFLTGHTGQPAWSPSGERLAFTRYFKDKDQRDTSIHTIYFPLINSKQVESKLEYTCISASCSSVRWLSEDKLVFISNEDNHNKILQYNLKQQTSAPLYQGDKQNIYSIDYSAKRKQLAFMLLNSQKQHQLFLLDIKSKQTSAVEFSPNKGNDYWRRWFIKWNANHDGFVTSTDSRLFYVGLDGSITEQSIPTYMYVMQPEFHPKGQSIALSLGYRDFDNVEARWSDTSNDVTTKVLSRSIRRESYPKYQPNDKGVAFLSDRSGIKQLWYRKQGTLKQISQVGENQTIVHYLWSPAGDKLLLLVNKSLYLADLQGHWQKLAIELNVIKLFQWRANNQILLASHQDGQQHVAMFNLTDYQAKNIYQGDVRWAQQSADNSLYLTNFTGQLSLLKDNQLYQLNSEEQTMPDNRFIYKADSLYWLTHDSNLWRYKIKQNESKQLIHLEMTEAKLSDINPKQQRLLVSSLVATNKEIVLLHSE